MRSPAAACRADARRCSRAARAAVKPFSRCNSWSTVRATSREPGIFVAFEENSRRIVANAESFGWRLGQLRRKKLLFVDAQPNPDLVQSGDFDLCGMLAGLAHQAKQMKARRIVFDALDMVLSLLPDLAARRREIYRLHDWLMARDLTCIFTLKAGAGEPTFTSPQPYGFMQFMVDCSVILTHSVVLGVSQRNLRVQKYRGSSFDENESPFVIGDTGFNVAISRILGQADAKVTHERVSSGVKRLDTMLGGGYYRAAAVLITGVPGTAKTTLSGAFAEAACRQRRAHHDREFRLGRQRGHSQSDFGGNPAGALCEERTAANGVGAHHYRQRRGVPGADQGARGGAQGPLSGDRSGVRAVEFRQRSAGPRRGRAADRLVEVRSHYAGVHQPAQ